jgi:lysozyme
MGRTRAALLAASTAVAIAAPAVAYMEGLRLFAYKDPVGIPTICYGHIKGVQMGDTATKAECDKLMKDDLLTFALAVDDMVIVPLKPHEHAALTSFSYNVGLGALKSSTLLRRVNAGELPAACDELSRWVYAKGLKFNGLIKRREAERKMCRGE